jgi:hypothetical protein
MLRENLSEPEINEINTKLHELENKGVYTEQDLIKAKINPTYLKKLLGVIHKAHQEGDDIAGHIVSVSPDSKTVTIIDGYGFPYTSYSKK